jgi:hypothetical protein
VPRSLPALAGKESLGLQIEKYRQGSGISFFLMGNINSNNFLKPSLYKILHTTSLLKSLVVHLIELA